MTHLPSQSAMQSSKSPQPDGAHCAMFQCLLTHLAKVYRLTNTRSLSRQSVIFLSLSYPSLSYLPPFLFLLFPPLLFPPSLPFSLSFLSIPLPPSPYIPQADVLHVYFDRVWQLLPKRFRCVPECFSKHEMMTAASLSLPSQCV